MSFSEEEMLASLKASVLDENRPLLCSNLDPRLHYPYLRSRYVLSKDDEELIEIQQLRKLKVHKLIDILMTRGRRGFDELITSIIQERTQLFLAEKLNIAFEDKRKRLMVLTDTQLESQKLEGIEESSNSKTDISDLTSSVGSQPCTSNTHTSSLTESRRYPFCDLGVDTDKLPKPVMPKSKCNHGDDLKGSLPRIKSCENSLDEDSDDLRSLPDSEYSEKESKA